MNKQSEHQVELLCWYSAMVATWKTMPESEKNELQDWEVRNLDGHLLRTSDWPGWKKYIGEMPVLTDTERMADRRGYVYLIRVECGAYKIGQTTNVNARFRNFRTNAPFEFELIHAFSADDRWSAERLLHKRFSKSRTKGEWFELGEDDIAVVSQISGFANGEFIKRQK